MTGIIAGGNPALRTGIEGIEDDPVQGKTDPSLRVTNKDVVVGIAPVGAPLCHRCLDPCSRDWCQDRSCSLYSQQSHCSPCRCGHYTTGGSRSTNGLYRMKAGTAQKMVLNMLTTTTMIRWGKFTATQWWMSSLQIANSSSGPTASFLWPPAAT